MGGIIGKLSFERDETLARHVLEQMLDAVSHRGLADRDIHVAPGIALGSSEVACVSSVRVVADARLVNARELRGELRRLGGDVDTASDAHLMAHAYHAWGSRCFAKLEGPFSCAIWDARSRRLLLARDPLGIRPLYFALLHGHGVAFASEINALFHDPGVTRDYSPAAIDAYLALGYVPAPLTAFRRVSKVEPGQFLEVDGRRLHAEQYWDPPPADGRGSIERTAHNLEAQLRMATHEDTAPGSMILCSGDVASSVLAWAAPPDAGAAVMVAVEQEPGDLLRARSALTALGHIPEIEVAAINPALLASDLAARLDEPLADPAAVAQYATFLAAALHGTHAVAAHGATALFDGAKRHTVWDGDQRRSIYTRAFAWEVRDINPRSRYQELCDVRASSDPFDRSAYVQLRSVLPESSLMAADRTSLAAGITLRLPFLDRRFVEFAAAIPSSVKRAGAGPLPLLRRILEGKVPREFLPRPTPRTAVPSWLERTIAAMVPRLLLASRFDGRGIVSRPALRTLWAEHRSGRRNHALRFWSLLMLEFWFREFIDGDAAEDPLEYVVLKAA